MQHKHTYECKLCTSKAGESGTYIQHHLCKKKVLIPAAQPLLALPGEIDLQRSWPYINKGDLAVHGSRINSLCMKPLEADLSPACKTLLL